MTIEQTQTLTTIGTRGITNVTFENDTSIELGKCYTCGWSDL